jgi:hypothetical protein
MAAHQGGALRARALAMLAVAVLVVAAACSSPDAAVVDPGSGPPGFKGPVPEGPAVLPPADDPGSTAGLLDPSILTPHDGDLIIRNDGEVVENLDVTGAIVVKAVDVTLRNVRVRPPEGTDVDEIAQLVSQQGRGAGLVAEHVELDGRGVVPAGFNDNSGRGMVIRSSEIHGVGNGVQFTSNTLIEGNWIHDVVMRSDWHPDGIQTDAAFDFTVRANRVTVGAAATSAIGIWADLGDVHRGEVVDNVVAGGGFVFYAQEADGFSMTDVVFRGNVISTEVHPDGGGYGVWYPNGIPTSLVRVDNRFSDGRPADS